MFFFWMMENQHGRKGWFSNLLGSSSFWLKDGGGRIIFFVWLPMMLGGPGDVYVHASLLPAGIVCGSLFELWHVPAQK